MYQHQSVYFCAVNRDNVIFALTHHGGHLGYFEGGILLPNSKTWLDRVIVEFSLALLHCEATVSNQQQCPTYITSSLFAGCEPLAKKSPPADDADTDAVDLQLQKNRVVESSASPSVASRKASTMDELAAEMVADILRVSASVVYSDTEDGVQNGTLANNDNAATVNHKC